MCRKIDECLIHFLLLNGYSKESLGLMHGKLGIALSLFESSRISINEIEESYASDLFQEVLASSTADCSFDNGKIGIAWAILYLINNQYIDADYMELYALEHNSIIEKIKKSEDITISQSIDYLFFLSFCEPYVLTKDFEIIGNKLINIIIESIAETKVIGIAYDCFYLYSIKIIGLYNIYENKRFFLKPLVDFIIVVFKDILKTDNVCNKLLFGIELFKYGKEAMEEEIIFLADSIISTYFSNILVETLDYKTAVDTLYCIERLSGLGRGELYQAVKTKLNDLFQDKTSHLYRVDRETLAELQRGIARYVCISTSDISSWTSEKHVIMLN